MKYYSDDTVRQILKEIQVKSDLLEVVKEINGEKKLAKREYCHLVVPNVEDHNSISFPDNHGRLIDVDKLIASFRKWADAPIKRTNNEIADFLEEYSKDSTIVEANNDKP